MWFSSNRQSQICLEKVLWIPTHSNWKRILVKTERQGICYLCEELSDAWQWDLDGLWKYSMNWRWIALKWVWSDECVGLSQWCSPRDQGLGLEVPRGQKWKSWSWIMKSWSWSWTFGLEEKVLQFFKTFIVILDGSEQGTPGHFVRDNKSSLPFGSHCLREPSALHAHQPQLTGYLTMGAIC